jgi:NADPH:quinone reductase-like Zn-dependent oxidoreductase
MASMMLEASESGTVTARRPATMKAAVQEGMGSAEVIQIREIPLPQVTPGRVLVRVRAASVNALDWHTVHGSFLLKAISVVMRTKNDPYRGVDLAGVVEAVAADVTDLRPGDEVCGIGHGTFAEYAAAPARTLIAKPTALTFAEAATIGIAPLVALQAVRDHARLSADKRVLIYGGGGGIGTFTVQIAKALGAHVTAVTGPKNVELLERLGTDVVIDYTKEDVLTRPARYHAVIDVAATRSIGALRRVLVPGGQFVQVGAAKSGGSLGVFGRIIALILRQRVLKQHVLMVFAKTRRDDMLFIRELVESGKIRPVIDREFPLEQTADAVRYLGTGQARAKVVITV